MTNTFDELKKLDELSELREKADDKHKPIFDAKIGYILKKINERKIVEVVRSGRLGR